MSSKTHEQASNLDDLSMPFEPELSDAFYSEFLDFGPGNDAFFETLADPSEHLVDPLSPLDFDNAMNASGVQPSAAGLAWSRERQENLEPATVNLPQLNLNIGDKSDRMQLDLDAGSQQLFEHSCPQWQPHDDIPQQQQRILPVLAPRTRRIGTDLQHPSDDKTPEKAKAAKRRTKPYREEDITCRHCNIKMETPGELR